MLNRIFARGISASMFACLVHAIPAQSPSPHATRVVAFDTNSGAGGGIFQPANVLGAPSGGGAGTGSQQVHSLGIGGWITVGFDVTILNGPGADFIVAENPFFLAGTNFQSFAEVAFVEVSSDGVTFARLPSRYFGPAVQPGPFGSIIVGSYENLAGSTPVYAGPPNIDAQDVVSAGGDAFDLGELANHPDVLAGRVDLNAIREIRLVDVRSGIDTDSRGIPIFDPGAGSADIDAVTAIHYVANAAPNGPSVELAIPVDGRFTLTLADPDGLLNLISLQASIYGIPIPPGDLLGAMTVTHLDPNRASLQLAAPLPPQLRFQLGFSVRDWQGHRSGAQRSRQDGR